MQEEVRSKLFEAVKIAVSVVDDACVEPTAEVEVRLEDDRGLNKPILQMGLPARVVEVTE